MAKLINGNDGQEQQIVLTQPMSVEGLRQQFNIPYSRNISRVSPDGNVEALESDIIYPNESVVLHDPYRNGGV